MIVLTLLLFQSQRLETREQVILSARLCILQARCACGLLLSIQLPDLFSFFVLEVTEVTPTLQTLTVSVCCPAFLKCRSRCLQTVCKMHAFCKQYADIWNADLKSKGSSWHLSIHVWKFRVNKPQVMIYTVFSAVFARHVDRPSSRWIWRSIQDCKSYQAEHNMPPCYSAHFNSVQI